MANKKTPSEKIPLGGGISLLSGKVVKNSPQIFNLGVAYSLGRDAFCVETGLAQDVFTFAKLARLEQISHLQFLSVLPLNGHGIRGLYPHTFGHNRLVHSFRTAVLAVVAGKNCGLDESTKEELLIAGLLHDVFTCAGGDSWKDINCQGTLFDEDNDFAAKIFRYFGESWKDLCNYYGWDADEMAANIADIVAGKGLLGGFQEIADTASYMLGDLEEIRRTTRRHKNPQDFARILQAAEHIWDIWKRVSVCQGKVVVTDPVALNNFLVLRILLWVEFYQNPRIKYLEQLMLRIVYPYMVDKKLIKISELPTKTSKYIIEIVCRHMGWADVQIRNLDVLGAFPKLKAFADWSEAVAFEEEKYRVGAATLIYDARQFQLTKTKVDKYLVIGQDGQAQTFASAYPEHASAIEEIACKATAPRNGGVQVAWVENPKISDNYRRAWEMARAKWRKEK